MNSLRSFILGFDFAQDDTQSECFDMILYFYIAETSTPTGFYKILYENNRGIDASQRDNIILPPLLP